MLPAVKHNSALVLQSIKVKTQAQGTFVGPYRMGHNFFFSFTFYLVFFRRFVFDNRTSDVTWNVNFS